MKVFLKNAMRIMMLIVVLVCCKTLAAEAVWKPDKPVTLLIGNNAGGSSDLFGRQIAKIITDNNFCEQPIVVVNMPGGSFTVAYAHLRQQADPYMIAVTSSSYFTMPLTGNSPVAFSDFTPIAHFCQDLNMVVVPANSPFNNLDDIVAYARANPSRLKFAGSNPFSDDRIICEMLNDLAGIDIQYVPFGTSSEILVALLGSHVDMGAMGPNEAEEHAKNGDLKPIVISANQSAPDLPDVPTFAEIGYNINQQQSRAIIMEKSAPPEVVAYYSDLMAKVYNTPEWTSYMEMNGMVGLFLNHVDYPKFHDELVARYKAYIDVIMEKENQ